MEFGLGLSKIIPLLVYISGGVIVLLTLFYRIEIGIFFIVPLFPLQNLINIIHKYPLGKDFIDILILALLIKWVLNSRKETNHVFFTKTPLNLPVFALILWTYIELWMGASYLGFPAPIKFDDFRFIMWKNFIILPIIFLIVVNNIKDPKHIKILILLMTLSMLAMDFTTYNSLKWQDKSHYNDKLGTQGTFSYLGRAELAIFYAQYTMLLVSVFLSDQNIFRKALYGITMSLNFYCLIFSYARGGYLGAFVGLSLIGLLKNRVVFVFLVLFLFSWQAFVPQAVVERIEMTHEEGEFDGTSQQRFGMWAQGIQIFLQRPINGVGYFVIPYLGLTDGMSDMVRPHVHNAYIQTAAELGLVGILIFLLIFFYGIRAGWKLYKIADDGFSKGLGFGLIACTLGNMTGNMFGCNWHYLNVMGFYWVTLALVSRSIIIFESRTKDSNNHE